MDIIMQTDAFWEADYEDGEEFVHPEQKVLRNELILKLIFGFLPFPDLLTARAVNKIWKSISDTLVAQKSVLWCEKFLSRWSSSYNFTKKNVYNFKYPFDNYLFESPPLNLTPEEHEQRTQFWDSICDRIAANAKHLTCFQNTSYFGKCKWTHVMDYVKLRSFTLIMNESSNRVYRDFWHPVTVLDRVTEIIKNAPLLDTVWFLAIHPEGSDVIQEFLMTMGRKKGTQIKNLRLVGHFQDSQLKNLTKLNLRLSSFKIQYRRRADYPVENLQRFLEQQKDNLEELEIESWRAKAALTIPRMARLQSLKLNATPEELANLDFAEKFPVLRALVLRKTAPDNAMNYVTRKMLPLKTVEILDCECSFLQKAVMIFPEVRNLTLGSSRNLEFVTQFRKVENLTVLWSEEDTQEEFKLVCKNQSVQESGSVNFFANLKTLKLKDCPLSDSGALFIFDNAKSLRCLDLWESKQATVTDSILQKMRNKFSVYCKTKGIEKDE